MELCGIASEGFVSKLSVRQKPVAEPETTAVVGNSKSAVRSSKLASSSTASATAIASLEARISGSSTELIEIESAIDIAMASSKYTSDSLTVVYEFPSNKGKYSHSSSQAGSATEYNSVSDPFTSSSSGVHYSYKDFEGVGSSQTSSDSSAYESVAQAVADQTSVALQEHARVQADIHAVHQSGKTFWFRDQREKWKFDIEKAMHPFLSMLMYELAGSSTGALFNVTVYA
ncbi:MAG: hypothetical protein Q7K43_01550 [Candidatus Woesearchaeota archaeon]|nr:hypothetical protein [Candidatus Woesearchaeota archaeon]